MYGAFFNNLPGPKWLRFLIMIFLFVCVMAFLIEVAFPMVEEVLPNTESTVDS